MKFRELSQYLQKIEKSSSRLTITHLLSELIHKLKSGEIDKALYLMQGRVAPQFESIEFGMAEKMIMKSVLRALHLEKKLFETQYAKIGDFGETVEYFKKTHKSFEERDPSVKEVYNRLREITTKSGEKSQDVKISLFSYLILQVDSLSAKYLVRIPLGVLRLGFSDMTVLDAFSWYLKGDKSLRKSIENAYHVRPDLGYLGRTIKESGEKKLHTIRPEVFTPILMMRAERLSSGEEIIKKIGRCGVEPKYDGFRLQIHYKRLKSKEQKAKSEVRLYSRNLEDVTYMYPDLVCGVTKEVRADDEMIFEGEAIGFDPYSGSFLPFQETATRKRKYGIEEKAKEIPLKLFAFDLLYKDGKSFIQEPFAKRRNVLVKSIKVSRDVFRDTLLITKDTTIDEPKKLERLFDDAVSRGLEGIIAKKLDGIYQPGARGWNWIKFKRSYSSKITDTIDCLVMGYDLGKGRRAGFGIGAFLAGVYDEKHDVFVTVSKIGTGLSDKEWVELKKRCDKFKTKTKPGNYNVDKAVYADIWVRPAIVIEIRADEVTRSSVHTAGRKMKTSKSGTAQDVEIPGFALRFPRLERFRDDRRPDDATALPEVAKMYAAQKK